VGRAALIASQASGQRSMGTGSVACARWNAGRPGPCRTSLVQ
jgi:hypothetical protein